VNVQLTPAAASLPEGSYVASLVFSNDSSHRTQNTICSLAIGQSVVQNGGFESGDFTGWSLTGRTVVNGSSGGPTVYNAVERNTGGYDVAHSGTYGAFLGDTQLATLSQGVQTIPGYSYLLSFWLNNSKAGSVQNFLVNWDTNASGGNTIFTLSNPPAFGWTNLLFIVTAVGTNTVLQFGAENDPAGFGLDDISVKPLPPIGFSSIESTAGVCTLSWFSGTGIHYQVQYSSSLTQGNWTDLGSPVVGTGGMLTATDAEASSAPSQRFYRLAVLP
jgi:hypothetical protein